LLLLGKVYPFHYAFVRGVMPLGPDDSPPHEHIVLRALLHMREDTRRSRYAATLQQEINQARLEANPQRYVDLSHEQMLWRALVMQDLQQHAILPDKPGSDSRVWEYDGHLRWQGKRSKTGGPQINIWGIHDLSVVRALWPLYRTDLVLAEDWRPVRIPSCPSDDLDHPCVNPLHYERFFRTAPIQRFDPERTRPMVHYETVEDPGESYIVCWNCKNRLSENWQHKWQMGTLKPNDWAYCSVCYAQRRSEDSRMPRVRVGRAARMVPTEESLAAQDRIMATFLQPPPVPDPIADLDRDI